jgi:hypothetical protein
MGERGEIVIASDTAPGIVQGSSASFRIHILPDGTMEVNGLENRFTQIATKDADQDSRLENVEAGLSEFVAEQAEKDTAQDEAIVTVSTALTAHKDDKTNPHAVTAAQVGLGNADNTSDADKPVSTAQAEAIGAVTDALTAETARAQGKENEVSTALTAHKDDTGNPHAVTKAQVGLGNADDTSDADKPVSTAQAEAIGELTQYAAETYAPILNPHLTEGNNDYPTTPDAKLDRLQQIANINAINDLLEIILSNPIRVTPQKYVRVVAGTEGALRVIA